MKPHTVYYIDGSDVPYLALSDWPDLVAMMMMDPPEGSGPNLEFSMDGHVGTLTQREGYTVDFDCDADAVHFLDFDAFLQDSGLMLIDMVEESRPTPDGSIRYFRRDKSSYERYGREVTIDAAGYGIDFIADGGECYVPMQTLGDLLMYRYACFFYSGEVVIVGDEETLGSRTPLDLTALGEIYYAVEPRQRSEAMARFAYNELCLALDTHYGLKAQHDIARFDDLSYETGLKDDLTGTDPDAALYQLLELHLDDQHTAYLLPSSLSGAHASDSFQDELGLGQALAAYWVQGAPYYEARGRAYPDGVPVYEEIGNTAYITFDSFVGIPEDVDYYEEMPAEDVEDTIGIMIYAYSRITRPDSPIENVVLDMPCNGGGEAPTGIYTVAAFLGIGSMSLRDTFSGALVTGNYEIDINLDGKIDEGDRWLLDKNLFCLESPISFSCGNYLPCAFKESSRVALLGRTSGGGTCVVQPLSTADGSCFVISGLFQLSFLKNGAFYDIDRGAEPDFPLMKPDSFYDRQALTEFINSIR